MDNFLNKHLLLTTSHTPKEILKRKYSVNYKTSVLLLLIIVAKKKPRVLLENDVHVHFFMESPKSLRHVGAYQCYYCNSCYIQKAKYRKIFKNSRGRI